MLKIFSLAVALLAVPVFAQDDLPDGPGKATAVKICTGCHGAEMWSSSRKSGDDWDRTITTMTEKGLSISDDDYAAVMQYLTSAFGPLKRCNVNTAPAEEIAKNLGFSKAQADAIVGYRAKNGNFKDLDGLKKVDGISPSAIDMIKALIQF